MSEQLQSYKGDIMKDFKVLASNLSEKLGSLEDFCSQTKRQGDQF